MVNNYTYTSEKFTYSQKCVGSFMNWEIHLLKKTQAQQRTPTPRNRKRIHDVAALLHDTRFVPPLLSSYHFFIRRALSCANTNTDNRDEYLLFGTCSWYVHSRSVVSNPSLNICGAESIPPPPPPPTGPKAAKCCAWSITSTRRPLNV